MARGRRHISSDITSLLHQAPPRREGKPASSSRVMLAMAKAFSKEDADVLALLAEQAAKESDPAVREEILSAQARLETMSPRIRQELVEYLRQGLQKKRGNNSVRLLMMLLARGEIALEDKDAQKIAGERLAARIQDLRTVFAQRGKAGVISTIDTPQGGVYRIADDLSDVRIINFQGRTAFSKELRATLDERDGHFCARCGATQDLQPDHRIPFVIAGDRLTEDGAHDPDGYQWLCAPCNTKKRTACQKCPNYEPGNIEDTATSRGCMTCAWASPKDFIHEAGDERPARFARLQEFVRSRRGEVGAIHQLREEAVHPWLRQIAEGQMPDTTIPVIAPAWIASDEERERMGRDGVMWATREFIAQNPLVMEEMRLNGFEVAQIDEPLTRRELLPEPVKAHLDREGEQGTLFATSPAVYERLIASDPETSVRLIDTDEILRSDFSHMVSPPPPVEWVITEEEIASFRDVA